MDDYVNVDAEDTNSVGWNAIQIVVSTHWYQFITNNCDATMDNYHESVDVDDTNSGKKSQPRLLMITVTITLKGFPNRLRKLWSTPGNEALCGKINFELWAKMSSKVKICQKIDYA